MSDMSKAISALIQELDAGVARAEQLCSGLSEDQFNWNPEPGRWSIGQCLAHLNLVDGGDVTALLTSVGSGTSANMTGRGPFQYGYFSRKFVASMEPPVTRAFKAPAYYAPPPRLDSATVFTEYRKVHAEIRDIMKSAEGLDLARVKATLPALPSFLRAFIKMPLGARLELLTAHDRRHLHQAEQVKSRMATR